MRVIAGSVGGIRLDVPKGSVRPTMDRVKAAIFSALGEIVVGARVLDLFAGTGALGIEALSRGALSAVFVENNRAAVSAIERNLARTNFRGAVRPQDVFAFLRGRGSREQFEIIFADPPYEKTKSDEAFTNLLLADSDLRGSLAPAGVFVLEKRPGEAMPSFDFWQVTRAKTYGATEVLFLQLPSASA